MSIICKVAIPIASVVGGGWPQPALIPEGRPPSVIMVRALPPSLWVMAPPSSPLAPVLVPAVLPAPELLPLLVPSVPPTLPLVAQDDPLPTIAPAVAPEPGAAAVPPAVPVLACVEPLGLPELELAPVEPTVTVSFGFGFPPQPTAMAPRTPKKVKVREGIEGTIASTVRHSFPHCQLAPENGSNSGSDGCTNPAQLDDRESPKVDREPDQIDHLMK